MKTYQNQSELVIDKPTGVWDEVSGEQVLTITENVNDPLRAAVMQLSYDFANKSFLISIKNKERIS